MNVWGIHMGEKAGSAPIDNNYVGIGWEQLGDLKQYSVSRESLKEALSKALPESKKGAIPQNAGVLFRFVNEIKQGDIVIYPSKDRVVNIGRVTSDYIYVADDPHDYTNHRQVEWLGHFERNEFSQSALNEIGSALTLFAVKTHSQEFLTKIGLANSTTRDVSDDETADDESITETISFQAQQTTEDFIIKQLHAKLDGYEFEYFVAHLLECMGYKARVSSKSGDGGVDVIAHSDELGFEPPIIKVQCKKSLTSNGEPEVNQLLGSLGEGEYGLFVNLGSYSRPARLLERNKPKLRLIDGEELVDLILEHYPSMLPKYRSILPLKQIYVADLG